MTITGNTFIWCIVHPSNEFTNILHEYKNIDSVIFYSLEESLDWNNLFNTQLSEKLSLIGDLSVQIVVNDTCTFNEYRGIPLIKLPAFLLKTVHRTRENQETNPKWNSESNKALVLTGKSHNVNRIGLLVEMVKQGILKKHIYSFFSPKEKNYLNKTLETFSESCDWEYGEFVKEYENNPDGIDIRNTEEDMHYSGFPYSVDLYKDTLISIIPETNCYENGNRPDFSEKTYKAIINKHPFLMLNQPNSFPLLKQYGFHTFEEYMKHKDYDLTEDPFEKNKLVIENLNYFIDTYKNFESEINRKVDENYNLMIKIYNDFKSKYPVIYEGLCGDFFHR